MPDPSASRPYMPGYGVVGAGEGTGLLRWSWATDRLAASHDYWLATVRPDGRPHVMPVWGVWDDDGLRFSTSPTSRKAHNLEADPRCVVTTDNALEPVIVEGTAELVTDATVVERYTVQSNEKYDTSYDVSFYAENALYLVRPSWVFALAEEDFTGTPTRWVF